MLFQTKRDTSEELLTWATYVITTPIFDPGGLYINSFEIALYIDSFYPVSAKSARRYLIRFLKKLCHHGYQDNFIQSTLERIHLNTTRVECIDHWLNSSREEDVWNSKYNDHIRENLTSILLNTENDCAYVVCTSHAHSPKQLIYLLCIYDVFPKYSAYYIDGWPLCWSTVIYQLFYKQTQLLIWRLN